MGKCCRCHLLCWVWNSMRSLQVSCFASYLRSAVRLTLTTKFQPCKNRCTFSCEIDGNSKCYAAKWVSILVGPKVPEDIWGISALPTSLSSLSKKLGPSGQCLKTQDLVPGGETGLGPPFNGLCGKAFWSVASGEKVLPCVRATVKWLSCAFSEKKA